MLNTSDHSLSLCLNFLQKKPLPTGGELAVVSAGLDLTDAEISENAENAAFRRHGYDGYMRIMSNQWESVTCSK